MDIVPSMTLENGTQNKFEGICQLVSYQHFELSTI